MGQFILCIRKEKLIVDEMLDSHITAEGHKFVHLPPIVHQINENFEETNSRGQNFQIMQRKQDDS